MIKQLDRYLLRYFITALVTVSLAFGLLIVAINMVEELRRFLDNQVPLAQIAVYYTYYVGWIVKSFLPVFVLLAALISIGILARRNEILALKASGVSLYRISAPLLLFTFLLSVGHICYNELIFPEPNKKRVEMREYVIKKHSRDARLATRNIYRQVNKNLFFVINSYNIAMMEGQDIKIYHTRQDRLAELVTARRIRFTSQNWVLYDGVRRIFGDSGETFIQFDSLPAGYIEDRPADFEVPLGKPEDMGYEELKRYIELMKRTGGPYQHELVDLKLKLSFPFSSFIVILICVPIASNPKRGGIAVSFALGAAIALFYFVCFKVLQSLGYSAKLNADFAAWLINGIFLLLGIIIMFTARK
ncbi:MAG: LptF/LptG family permease [Candidatus Zixiibacteriota bacterium]|nr:MAG: LptF/LptG family permease [candidate division Zixibacteria bacterium]